PARAAVRRLSPGVEAEEADDPRLLDVRLRAGRLLREARPPPRPLHADSPPQSRCPSRPRCVRGPVPRLVGGVLRGRLRARAGLRRDEVAAGRAAAGPMTDSAPAPRYSVVIPTFQRRELVTGTVQALAAQENAPPFEVIVVVDGSTDETAAALRELGTTFPLTVV